MDSILRCMFTFAILVFGVCSPTKHSRRSLVSSNHAIQPELVVRIPLSRIESTRAPPSTVESTNVVERELGAHCRNNSQSSMSLIKLSGQGAATCNDGTEAGYYLLQQSKSKKWVIFLEGGWYCSDELSCKLRKFRDHRLTSSRLWYNCRTGEGIFSISSTENPHLYNANMVYIPYCSSDLWTGTVRRLTLGDEPFSFMGSVIVKQVVSKLIENHGMRAASVVLLAGSSAGGTGVFMNVDRVQALLRTAGSDAKVRGIVDSGWYLTRQRMETENHCLNARHCSPVTMLKKGVNLWRPSIPRRCVADHSHGRGRSPNSSRYFERLRDGTWKCFFGPIIYPYVEAELFIVQWMFDPLQLKFDRMDLMSYHTDTKRVQKYIQKLNAELKSSLASVNAAFVTACYAHTVLDSSEWCSIVISQVSLPDAIQCWEVQLDKNENEEGNDVSNYNVAETPRLHHLNQAELYNEASEEERGSDFASAEMVPDDDEYHDNYYAISYQNDTPEPSTISPTQCKPKLIDPCPLPQCNPSCRPLYDPYSQTRINPVDFLERLGINLHDIAERNGSNAAQLLTDLSRG